MGGIIHYLTPYLQDAVLVIVLAGFLAEGFRLAFEQSTDNYEFLGTAIAGLISNVLDQDQSIAGFKIMWWLHGLLGCGFIALIAYGPFSHMLLGPVNSAFANKRPGINLPAIDFDIDPYQ